MILVVVGFCVNVATGNGVVVWYVVGADVLVKVCSVCPLTEFSVFSAAAVSSVDGEVDSGNLQPYKLQTSNRTIGNFVNPIFRKLSLVILEVIYSVIHICSNGLH